MNEKYKKASMDHLHLILSLISMLHVERYTEILQFVMDTFWKLSQFFDTTVASSILWGSPRWSTDCHVGQPWFLNVQIIIYLFVLQLQLVLW